MEQITERLIDIGYGEINTITFGQGKPLFLLPGWTYSAKIFTLLSPYLANNFQITAIDLPGWIGKSKLKLNHYDVASYTKVIVDSFKIIYQKERRLISLGGISVGGTLALLAGEHLQGKIDKIFLQSSPFKGEIIIRNRKLKYTLLKNFAFLPRSDSFWKTCHKIGVILLFLRCRPSKEKEIKFELLKKGLEEYENLNPKAIMEFTKDFISSDFSQKIKIKNRVIFVACQYDNLIPPKEIKNYLSKSFVDSIYCEAPLAHHYFLGENPKEFARIIKKYL